MPLTTDVGHRRMKDSIGPEDRLTDVNRSTGPLSVRHSPTVVRSGVLSLWLNLALILVAGTAILLLAFLVVQRSEETLKSNLRSKFTSILNIEIEAIREWIASNKKLAGYLASDDELVALLQKMVKDPGNEETALAIRRHLAKATNQFGVENGLVMTAAGGLVESGVAGWTNQELPRFRKQFQETRRLGRATVSRLFEATVKQPQNDSSVLPEEPTTTHAMIVAAPIADGQGHVVGFLGIGIQVEDAFTSLLRSSRIGDTGETLVYDATGHRISRSRFGQLNRDAAADPLFQQLLAIRTGQRSGIQVDLSGHPDGRGQRVVSAGRWLSSLNFGVIHRMDHAEATAPITQIRQFLWTLCSLLLLTTGAMIIYRWYLMRFRRVAQAQELSDKRLGPYLLDEKLGEGGMGVVYRARHALLRRPTAVKILSPEKSSRASIARFEREVHFTSQLQHPNTISIYDFGRTETGLFYYAMEYLDGLNLDQLVKLDGSIPDGRVVSILQQICQSLAEAHGLGLIHRDIKPANIMLCDQGGAVDIVKVLDFGMVRDANLKRPDRQGSLSGTPAYMAPEAFVDPANVDARMDVFAIGAVGYYLLTTHPLLKANQLSEILKLHRSDLAGGTAARLRGLVANKTIKASPKLISIVSRCVAVDREKRFGSVDQVLCELDHCQPYVNWKSADAKAWWSEYARRFSDAKKLSNDREPANAFFKTMAFTRQDGDPLETLSD